jgi:hypothetical protein
VRKTARYRERYSWALRIARAHRRSLVREWVLRLALTTAGLIDAHRDASDACTHLVCIPWWPLTEDGMDAIAYLSQFELVCGPVKVVRDRYDITTQVAVVRTPAWAAAHAAALRSPLHSEPITNEWRQSIAMVRQHGSPLVSGEFVARRKPSRLVQDSRDEMDRASQTNYHPSCRPLRPGATPPNPFTEESWSRYTVRHALQGAEFVYGVDDSELLAMGLPADGSGRLEARLRVELQVGCSRHYDDDEPHMCEVEGVVESAGDNGALRFTPDGMCDSVTIPAVYIVGLSFR